MYPVIENPEEYNAAIYARLSKEDNRKDGDGSESIKNQIALITEYAEKQGINICETYIDDGVSGTTSERPDLERMINDIIEKKINMVITKDLSRLSRNYIHTGTFLEMFFPENEVRYISLLDGIDTGSEDYNDDITPFKGVLNDMYAKDISKKNKSVKRNKQKLGLFIGGKAPYGYVKSPKEKNKIVIDENAAETVRFIFSLALEGKSCRQIAVTLNEQNIPTPAQYAKLNISVKGPYSGKWSSERISDMLQNEVYIGNMVQGRVMKINYKLKTIKKLPREKWTVVENTHEAIIDKDTFQKVGELIKSRTHTRHRTYDFPLKGIVFCKECGYPLASINRKLAGDKTAMYFLCRTYQRFTQYNKCTSHCIRVDNVSKIVVDEVRKVCDNYLNCLDTRKLTENAQKQIEIELRKQGRDITALKKKIASIQKKKDIAYDDRLSDVIDKETYLRITKTLSDEEKTAQNKLTELENCKKDNPIINEDKIKELAKKFINTENHSRELFVSLIDRIELSENKELDIHFKFPELKIAERL